MALSWQVPTAPVGNIFSVTLVSDAAVTDVDANDFRLRGADGDVIILNDTLVSISQVTGTHNWRLDISLTGTRNQNYSIRLRRQRLLENRSRVPNDVLDSAQFSIDSSIVAPTTPANLTATTQDHDTVLLRFDAATGTVTQYQYRLSTTEAELSSATWVNGGTATSITIDNLSPDTTYYFQVRAANGNLYSSASNTANATTAGDPNLPFIARIASPQNFIVGTEFTLTAKITNIDTSAGDKVTVKGDLKGYKYGYNNTTKILTIVGTPTALVSGANFRIEAIKKGRSPVFRSVVYNVVPAAPIISQVTAPVVYIGQPYRFFIPIVNMPPKPVARGLWTGLKYEKREQGNREGLIISGTAGEGDFTVAAGEFEVDAPYAGGLVTATFAHTISKVPKPGAVRNMTVYSSSGNFYIQWRRPATGAAFITYYETTAGSGPNPHQYGFASFNRIAANAPYYIDYFRRTITTYERGTHYYAAVRAVSVLANGTRLLGPISFADGVHS